ncbi:MAG: YraN family protein [Candidatus Aminicenantales bacterium]
MLGVKRTSQDIGQTGEAIALKFLRRKGYAIVETRFRFLRGEIDIVARDRKTLVFVEVKLRTGEAFGRPEESVTPAKQRQIRKVAEGYLLRHGLGGVDCRFDVIAIRPESGAGCAVEHFVNAF